MKFRLHIGILFLILVPGLRAQNLDLARTYLKKGQWEKALAIYQEWEKQNGFSVRVYDDILKIYLGRQDFISAEDYIRRSYRKRPLAYMDADLYHVYRVGGQTRRAEEQWKKLEQKLRRQPYQTLAVVRRLRRYGYVDRALGLLNKYVKNQSSPAVYLEKGNLYAEKGQIDSMMTAYVRTALLSRSYLYYIQSQLKKYLTSDPSNPYNATLRRILLRQVMRHPEPALIELLEWLYVNEKQYDKAFVQAKGLYLRGLLSLHELLDLAEDALAESQVATALRIIDFVRQQAETQSPSALDRALWLRSLAEAARPEAPSEGDPVKTWLRRAARMQTEQYRFKLHRLVVDYLMRHKRLAQAYRLSDSLNRHADKRRQQAYWRETLGDILLHQGKFDQAAVTFTLLREDFPYDEVNYRALYKTALASFLGGDAQWAHQMLKPLKKAAQREVANDALWLDFLIISHTKPRDSLQTHLRRLALAYFPYYRRDLSALNRIADSLRALPDSQPIRDDLLFMQGRLAFDAGRWEQAARYWKALADMPTAKMYREEALYRLGIIFEKLNRTSEALKYYKELLKNYPEGFYFEPAQNRYRALQSKNQSL